MMMMMMADSRNTPLRRRIWSFYVIRCRRTPNIGERWGSVSWKEGTADPLITSPCLIYTTSSLFILFIIRQGGCFFIRVC